MTVMSFFLLLKVKTEEKFMIRDIII